jgi:hypothetical protein
MKNKLSDLNDHLFAQLERLNDEELTAEAIAKEVTRTDALVKVSEQIISNANMVLRGAALVAEYGGKDAFQHLLPMMGGSTKVIEGPKK